LSLSSSAGAVLVNPSFSACAIGSLSTSASFLTSGVFTAGSFLPSASVTACCKVANLPSSCSTAFCKTVGLFKGLFGSLAFSLSCAITSS